MKYIFIVIAALSITSCTQHFYKYNAILIKPVASDSLNFEDDLIKAKFRLDTKMIQFRIENKTEQGLKIPWDDVSLAVNGNSRRVVHKETGMTKLNDVQPPTTVSPNGYLSDAIIPRENVSVYRSNQEYTAKLKAIFPNTDYGKKSIKNQAMAWKGKDITLYFPFRQEDKIIPYTFQIRITDVIVSK